MNKPQYLHNHSSNQAIRGSDDTSTSNLVCDRLLISSEPRQNQAILPMSLLSAHFEQIAISCQGIDSLPYVKDRPAFKPPTDDQTCSFPPPKIFTNALLANHDITSLIRDTEAHERALFSVPPPPPPAAQRLSLCSRTPPPRAPRTGSAAP